MTTNLVLVNTDMLGNILVFLLRQNMIDCVCFVIGEMITETLFLEQKKQTLKRRLCIIMLKNYIIHYYPSILILKNNIADKEQMDKKYDPENLLLKGQRFTQVKKKEKSKSLSEESIAVRVKLRRQKADDMLPLEDDEEEVK